MGGDITDSIRDLQQGDNLEIDYAIQKLQEDPIFLDECIGVYTGEDPYINFASKL